MGEISCRGAVAVWELPAASPPQLSPIRSKTTQYHPVPSSTTQYHPVPGAKSAVLPEVWPLPLSIGAQCLFITLIKCLKGLKCLGVLQTVFVFVFWLMVRSCLLVALMSDLPGSWQLSVGSWRLYVSERRLQICCSLSSCKPTRQNVLLAL